MESDMLERRSAELKMVALHFSTACASRCPWCYAAENLRVRQPHASYELIERSIRLLAAEGIKEVLFVGGDPVLHPDFARSTALARECGLIVTVLSNSWALRPPSSFSAQLECIDNFEATVLGPTPELHDAVTKHRGSFETLIGNLAKIGEAGHAVGVCLNAIPETISQLFATVDSLVGRYSIPVRGVMIQRIIPSGGATAQLKFGLNVTDLEFVMEQVERIRTQLQLPVHFEDPVPLCTVDPKYHHLLSRCEWGYTKASVNSLGELNRCGADDHYRLGSIFDGPLRDRWATHPILVSFRNKLYLPPECHSCELLTRCGGGCPLSCGTTKDHDLDFLYFQKKKIEASGEFVPGRLEVDAAPEPRIRNIYPQDWDDISVLERLLFPGVQGLFTPDSLGRCLRRYPAGILVAEEGGMVVGYFGIFPLTSGGEEEVLRHHTTTVCDLDESHIATSLQGSCRAIFLEVIAFAPNCGSLLRKRLWRYLVQRFTGFTGRVYSCPVSSAGRNILIRRGFRPLTNDQVGKLFVLEKWSADR